MCLCSISSSSSSSVISTCICSIITSIISISLCVCAGQAAVKVELSVVLKQLFAPYLTFSSWKTNGPRGADAPLETAGSDLCQRSASLNEEPRESSAREVSRCQASFDLQEEEIHRNK